MEKIEDRVSRLDEEVEAIKARNRRVEADKAWEISVFRLVVLSAVTFIFSLAVLYFIKTENYLLSAFSSTAGLIISSQSLPFIKRWWVRKQNAH